MKQLIECVPNFSEGHDLDIIKQITNEIQSIPNVKLLDVDPGKATNRTVVTFVGEPEQVVMAAFKAIKKAAELIDMSKHKGEHPRMGATDVCPLIPIANISMEETVKWAHKLGEMVGKNLDFPIFMYESAATRPERTNLADVRAGEYEGLSEKLKLPLWKPDYGTAKFNPRSGATIIGARDFLVAYNVNLNTTSEKRANSVAFDVREQGRFKRVGGGVNGEIEKDDKGNPIRVPGTCKAVKGIGWFIPEYGVAQVSMNLTNINITPLHVAFEECCKSADRRGMRVTGSELVGLVPKKVMTDAGKYFLQKQKRSIGVSDEQLIAIAIKSLGLDELTPFDPKKKIIEYCMEDANASSLINMNLRKFANETSSESPAPGGGSVSAYVAALGASLGTMVANLSTVKSGWEDKWEYFSDWAHVGQEIKEKLLVLVDEDTLAYNEILSAFRLPKGNDTEKKNRQKAIQEATKTAIIVPLQVMKVSHTCFDLLEAMVKEGNPNSISDAGVGALCVYTAIKGAYMNVRINLKGFKDAEFMENILKEADAIFHDTTIRAQKIENDVLASMK
ncbi:MAG: glutamate formimidoyltransferase [Saprospiraceae bacterium]|nr:glutamate formimidoyltransferase [Saprospiraceae bacterium]